MDAPAELVRGCNTQEGVLVLADWYQENGREDTACYIRSLFGRGDGDGHGYGDGDGDGYGYGDGHGDGHGDGRGDGYGG